VTSEVDYSDAAYPLELVVNDAGVGGVSGLTCTVAIRQASTTNSYLDWSDATFKTSGWSVKNQPLTDLGTGIYQVALNVASLGFTPAGGLPVKLVAEYSSTGSGTSGLAIDTLIVSELRPDAKIARQFNTNKLVAQGGNPGTLVLYEDDGATVQSTQNLEDYAGGAVTNTPGSPAQRGSV